jgi:soluble lytic murein transglycosylase-like protein
MLDIKRLIGRAREGSRRGWERLSETQQLMLRGLAVFFGLVVLATAIGTGAPSALAGEGATYTGTAIKEVAQYRPAPDTVVGQLQLLRLRLARADEVLQYSARYRIPADLATLIYDTALREGVDPELAFRLVNIESRFRARATSVAGAYGLAQVQVATARFYDPDITVQRLYEPETNLRIGLRYLRDLIERYGDVKMALLAYNRGPTRVQQLVGQGRDPANGYATQLMEGYLGTF